LNRYWLEVDNIATADEKKDETTIEFVSNPRTEEMASLILRIIDAKVVRLEPEEEVETNEIADLDDPETDQFEIEPEPEDDNLITIYLGKDFDEAFRIPRTAGEVKKILNK
ncbi:MAG: hypothetical protein ACOC2U_01910, partial [bacterium]